MGSDQLGLFGKTCPESSPTGPTDSAAYSLDWLERMHPSIRVESTAGPTRVWLLDQHDLPRGVSLMLSISDWPSVGGGYSSLRDVLEECVPHKYFLSRKACAGILRRAKKRGKELPPTLGAALAAAAAAK